MKTLSQVVSGSRASRSSRRIEEAPKTFLAGYKRNKKTQPTRVPECSLRVSTDANGEAEKGLIMRQLCEIGDFVRRIRVQTRFGDLSRAKLKLLRFELSGAEAECNLLARPADPWDAGLPAYVADRNVSAQALKDAMSVRALLFRVFPDISRAVLRIYRRSGNSIELVIAGALQRGEHAPPTVRSLAMRAKLSGFRFWLDDGILESLEPEECFAGGA